MHSCHHAYRYIFFFPLSLFTGGAIALVFFFRLLGLHIMLLLVFLSSPEVRKRERWISTEERQGDSLIRLGGSEEIEELGGFEG